MGNDHDFKKVYRSRGRWRVCTVILALSLVGCVGYGYWTWKKAVIQSKKIEDAIISMRAALGVSTPSKHLMDPEVKVIRSPRQMIQYANIVIELGISMEKVFAKLQNEFKLTPEEPDPTRPEFHVWSMSPKGSENRRGETGYLGFEDNVLVYCAKRIAESDTPDSMNMAYSLMDSLEGIVSTTHNRLAHISVTRNKIDNSEVRISVAQKDLRLIVSDSPGGTKQVLLTELLKDPDCPI